MIKKLGLQNKLHKPETAQQCRARNGTEMQCVIRIKLKEPNSIQIHQSIKSNIFMER